MTVPGGTTRHQMFTYLKFLGARSSMLLREVRKDDGVTGIVELLERVRKFDAQPLHLLLLVDYFSGNRDSIIGDMKNLPDQAVQNQLAVNLCGCLHWLYLTVKHGGHDHGMGLLDFIVQLFAAFWPGWGPDDVLLVLGYLVNLQEPGAYMDEVAEQKGLQLLHSLRSNTNFKFTVPILRAASILAEPRDRNLGAPAQSHAEAMAEVSWAGVRYAATYDQLMWLNTLGDEERDEVFQCASAADLALAAQPETSRPCLMTCCYVLEYSVKASKRQRRDGQGAQPGEVNYLASLKTQMMATIKGAVPPAGDGSHSILDSQEDEDWGFQGTIQGVDTAELKKVLNRILKASRAVGAKLLLDFMCMVSSARQQDEAIVWNLKHKKKYATKVDWEAVQRVLPVLQLGALGPMRKKLRTV